MFQPSKIGGAGFRNHPAAISSTQRIFPESNGSFSSHDPLVFRMAMEVYRYYIQCEAPKIAKLVYNSNVTMVYGTYNFSYWGL